MAIMVDMEWAYDSVLWDFSEAILHKFVLQIFALSG